VLSRLSTTNGYGRPSNDGRIDRYGYIDRELQSFANYALRRFGNDANSAPLVIRARAFVHDACFNNWRLLRDGLDIRKLFSTLDYLRWIIRKIDPPVSAQTYIASLSKLDRFPRNSSDS